jgi:predicted phage replisome organizer
LSDVKWIKLYTDMFDNRKIKYIRNLPQGNDILLMWIMLLIYAGRTNDNGYVYLIEEIPYTNEDFAKEFDLPNNTVKLGLETLHRLKMIDSDSKGLKILNWNEYQNIDGLERIRELTRQRVRRFRNKEKQKELPESTESACNVTSNATVAFSNASRERRENKDILSSKEDSSGHERDQPVPYTKIVDLYHEICTSLPRVKALSQSRKGYIKARWQEHPDMEFWKEFFAEVEDCKFLTGKADYKDRKPFYADLEWLTRPNNFLKVLEGKYRDKEEAVVDAERRAIIENIRRLKAERTQ